VQVIDSDGHLHEPFDLLIATLRKNSIRRALASPICAMSLEIPAVGWSRGGSYLACRLPKAWAEEAFVIRRRAMRR